MRRHCPGGGRAPKPLIQIGVEVVEVDEQKALNLGIQWLGTLHVAEASVPSLFEIGTLTRGSIFADLQFLEQNGAADLLANPKLVARDGASATFHAGGEIPYATAASLGNGDGGVQGLWGESKGQSTS